MVCVEERARPTGADARLATLHRSAGEKTAPRFYEASLNKKERSAGFPGKEARGSKVQGAVGQPLMRAPWACGNHEAISRSPSVQGPGRHLLMPAGIRQAPRRCQRSLRECRLRNRVKAWGILRQVILPASRIP
jgi:hypothetical protein